VLNPIVRNSNFHSNDCSILQQRLAELEAELSSLDTDYDRLTLENEELKHQHEEIKGKNKHLFEQLTSSHDQGFLTEDSIQHPSVGGVNDVSMHQHSSQLSSGGVGPTTQPDEQLVTTNIGEIHSLYQDLFLTDIKKEVESA
jgi:hypothetical protein